MSNGKFLPVILSTTAMLAVPAFGHDDTSKLGHIDFPVSCNEAGQHAVTDGVLLLHHMMYDQAEERFRAASAADPTCVMAEWGVAMTQFHPMWPGGQSDAALATGMAALERIGEQTAPTAREAAYIAAANAFYEKAADPYPVRLQSWARAQRAVAAEFPDDVDAAAFGALAMLSVAAPRDQTFHTQLKAGEILEGLYRKAPDHPGVFHYSIHAYDHPPLASKAESFAAAYDKMAPEVPHALHMPSHIFVRLGKWPEVAEWNRRSAEAALDQPMEGGVVSGHYAHAQDYLIYALLQMGDVEGASAELRALEEKTVIEDDFGSAYALTAAPARLVLETEDWEQAGALAVPSHSSISWERFPQAKAIAWYTKGLGAAKSGDSDNARISLEELGRLRTVMNERNMAYWVTLADAQIGTIEAWQAFSTGDEERAVELMRAAAETEDSVGKAPVTPSHVLPARELLGDMLRELDHRAEALEAYQAALTVSPNRRRSLHGVKLTE